MSPVVGRPAGSWRPRGWRLLVGLATLAALAGCHPRPPSAPVPVEDRPFRPPDPVAAHLLCFECADGELLAVADLGPDVVPSLEEALRGPPAPLMSGARARFSTIWQRAARYRIARGETPALTETEYIRQSLPNFVASVQTRAVLGLAAVGGPEAEDALRTALADYQSGELTYRADVVQAIQDALATM